LINLVCCNQGCTTCGKALYATDKNLPSKTSSNNDCLLLTTTINGPQAVVQITYTKEELMGLFGDKQPSQAMIGCL
jgi:hypothetical protein